MEILKVIITSSGSLVALFLLTKIIGSKQINQLNFFDYIIGISIGSIAAEMSTSEPGEFIHFFISMAIYAFASWGLAYLMEKSKVMRRVVSGRTVTLMSEGKLFEQNFKHAKVDINEFLIQSHVNGYFDLDEIEYAFLEANGRMTFLPKADCAPLRPKDMKVTVSASKPYALIVSDGDILRENLKEIGRDEAWLRSKLAKQNIGELSTVFLACSDGDKVRAYKKQNYRQKNDIFQ